MTEEELRKDIGELIWKVGVRLNVADRVADQILAIPEIKRGLELVRIAKTIATRKKE